MNLTPIPAYRLVAETFERGADGRWTIVVQHVFYGQSEGECYRIMAAHLQADAFLRGCTAEGGRFGDITCTTTTRLERT